MKWFLSLALIFNSCFFQAQAQEPGSLESVLEGLMVQALDSNGMTLKFSEGDTAVVMQLVANAEGMLTGFIQDGVMVDLTSEVQRLESKLLQMVPNASDLGSVIPFLGIEDELRGISQKVLTHFLSSMRFSVLPKAHDRFPANEEESVNGKLEKSLKNWKLVRKIAYAFPFFVFPFSTDLKSHLPRSIKESVLKAGSALWKGMMMTAFGYIFIIQGTPLVGGPIFYGWYHRKVMRLVLREIDQRIKDIESKLTPAQPICPAELDGTTLLKNRPNGI